MNDDLYDRQRRLPGVGDAGQAAIERSTALIPSGPSASIALAYLVRGGVGKVEIHRAAPPSASAVSGHWPRLAFPHRQQFRFDGPLEVARGAHQALIHLLHSVRTQ